jgi:hypothetical protein
MPTEQQSPEKKAGQSVIERAWYGWLVVALVPAMVIVAVTGGALSDGPPAGQPVWHQTLGVLVTVLLLGHLAVHHRWLARVFRQRKATSRAGFIGLGAMTALLGVVALSGAMMGGVDDPIARTQPWVSLHHAGSKLFLLMAIWHVVRRRKYLWRRLRTVARNRVPEV